MSTDIYFYLGYKKDNKIFPLGPFTDDGSYTPIFYRCNHSNLTDYFQTVENYKVFDKSFWEKLESRGWEIDLNNLEEELKWLNISTVELTRLPEDTDYIQKGYYLRDQIDEYEQSHDSDCLWGGLTVGEYARKLEKEVEQKEKHTKKSTLDELQGSSHTCADYSFYAYLDTDTKAYEVMRIRRALEMMEIEMWEPTYNDYPVEIIMIVC